MLSPQSHQQPNLQASLYSLNQAQSTSMLHQPRARSVSPNNGQLHMDTSYDPQPGAFHRASQQHQQVPGLYNELQFPAASNYGSMKKRSQRSQRNSNTSTQHTGSTTVLSTGEPSPPSSGAAHDVSASVDNVHRYVPDFVAVGGRKTAV